jgi:hypothetical protein
MDALVAERSLLATKQLGLTTTMMADGSYEQ